MFNKFLKININTSQYIFIITFKNDIKSFEG